ncbi:MAG: fluoride efflux transporter CrcB [Wenzhouxiangellaceae bacterium]
MNAGFDFVPLLAVAAGCAIGAVARFEISRRIVERSGDAFPWATLTVNLSGCLLAGILLAMLDSAQVSVWGLLLTVGLLGGYTTVSSFSLETLLLFQRGHSTGALAYIAASMFGCIIAAASGFGLALFATGAR